MKILIIFLILGFTNLASAELTVSGNYTTRTGTKTVYTKQLRFLTEGTRPARPLDSHYFKNEDSSIVRWNRGAWEATTETVRSLTGRDEL